MDLQIVSRRLISAPVHRFPPRTLPLLALFFFSGALALVYEVLWQRRFALVFGSAAPATAAVLGAYFGGLAVGSWLMTRREIRKPLITYALLEGGVGFGAMLVEQWLGLFETIGASSLWAKTALAFVALALPTICMGATLPALGAFIDDGRRELGRTAGLLYVLNTAGAAVGVLIVPFVLLPLFGARSTLFLCAFANILLACSAWKLGLASGEVRRPPPANAERPVEPGRFTPYVIAFVAGFVSFVVQVSWNRAFGQVHENSMYSFSVIAAIFIVSIAVGAEIARIVLAKNIRPEAALSTAWTAAGFLLVASPLLFIKATNNLSYIVAANGWWNYALKLGMLGMGLIFPAATLIGMALPLLMQRAGREGSAERALGGILTVNLVGAVLGALTAGFVFPTVFGLWKTMAIAGLFISGIGIGRFKDPVRSVGVLILFGIFFPLMHHYSSVPRTRVMLDRGEKLVALTEGPYGIAAVIERGRSRRLKLNNSYVLGGTMSTGDERMQSHLPLLMHPNPKRVAYMGLGTGITAGGAAFHPLEQVTILELAPEVANAAREHFGDANMRILEQPNTRMIVEDARNFLRHTDEKFDVIIGDLVVPWRAGEASLFTVENFAAGKRALAPGGVFCQWLPLFQLSESEFDILLGTFLSVFPSAYIWRGDFSPVEPSLALVGFADRYGSPSDEVIRKRLAQMKRDPTNPQLTDPFAVWMSFVGAVDRSPGAKMNSEDHPWVELLAPLNHSGNGKLFVGSALHHWMEETAANSENSVRIMERIQNKDARRAGLLLSEYTLALSENNDGRARAAATELKKLMPSTVYALLFPSEPK